MGHWAMTTMSWIFHAQEPLQVDELRHALLIGGAIGEPLQAGDARFSHGDLLSKEAILACCCGLVEIKLNPHSRDTFRFIHYSVQEFFTARKERPFPNFHAHISLACAKYVSIPRLAHSNGEPENAYTETLQDGPNDYVEEHRIYGELQEIQKHEQLCGKQNPHDHLDSIWDKSRSIADYSDGQGVLKNLNYDLKLLLYPFIIYTGKYLSHHFSNIDGECDRLIVEEQICRHLESSNFYMDLVNHNNGHELRIRDKLSLAAYIGSSNLVEKFVGVGFPHGCGWHEWRDWLSSRELPARDVLDVAMYRYRPRIVNYVLRAGDMVNLTRWFGYSLLCRAAQGKKERNYCKEVNQVLDEIRDYVAELEKTANSKSWLTWASESVAETFNSPPVDIHHFREVNPVKLLDHIRLLSASANGRSAEVLDILKTGRILLAPLHTDINFTSWRTRCCLVKCSFFLAVENLHLEVVKMFLDRGIDVNMRGFCREETALHRAVSKGSRLMVELLLSYNARIDLEDQWHDTVWTLVRHTEGKAVNSIYLFDEVLSVQTNAIFAVMQLLINASNDQLSSEAFISVIRLKDSDLVKKFLEHGIDPSIQSRSQDHPLALAIGNLDIKTIQLLLEYNADPNILDICGKAELDDILFLAELDLKDSEVISAIGKGKMGKAEMENTILLCREISKLLRSYGAKTTEELQSQAADN